MTALTAIILFASASVALASDNPYLLQGAKALGLSDEQLDALFITAAGIEA